MTSITAPASSLAHHRVVTPNDWIVERKALLAREKELTRLRDEVASERRTLAWVRVDKEYVFDTTAGPLSLAELFQGRRQLLVQHFMFGPGWKQGCKSCSFMADHLDGISVHLAQRDIALTVISRAPLVDIERFRARMGWRFAWASSNGNDFNRDFHVSFAPEDRIDGEVYYNYHLMSFPADEAPGISIFVKNDAGEVFHTYSTFGRGVEVMMGAYSLIDLTPQGRDESALPYRMDWVRHHDRYEPTAAQAACCSPRG